MPDDAPLTFATLLTAAGYSPNSVALLRHSNDRRQGATFLYDLWQNDRPLYERYQSVQTPGKATLLSVPHWASFVGLAGGKTLFLGLYTAKLSGKIAPGTKHALDDGLEPESNNVYENTLLNNLQPYSGRLWIDWGRDYINWVKRGDAGSLRITIISETEHQEPFPGFTHFIRNLSDLDTLPNHWKSALRSTSGIYLLTCPRTREQYVGSARGEEGLLGRWLTYAGNKHGGNQALKSRDPADYQVSVLETVGTALGQEDLLKLEQLWKDKLRSRDMGLNMN